MTLAIEGDRPRQRCRTCIVESGLKICQRACLIHNGPTLTTRRIKSLEGPLSRRSTVVEHYQRTVIKPCGRRQARHAPSFGSENPFQRELSFRSLPVRGRYK